ncbi:hypothetical protein BD289DRAFT_479225 [Coniella lustricola]|uniref:Uncharacterized protein n=1 Tax=Coniella lustricola TaxID=2025994 RepID=A0A2T3AJM8_9PEZI|nr:hypothetical protein BD289DRAFT_479225 [Coniella lustricola]
MPLSERPRHSQAATWWTCVKQTSRVHRLHAPHLAAPFHAPVATALEMHGTSSELSADLLAVTAVTAVTAITANLVVSLETLRRSRKQTPAARHAVLSVDCRDTLLLNQ